MQGYFFYLLKYESFLQEYTSKEEIGNHSPGIYSSPPKKCLYLNLLSGILTGHHSRMYFLLIFISLILKGAEEALSFYTPEGVNEAFLSSKA